VAPAPDSKVSRRAVAIISMVAAISGFLFGYTMHMIIGLVPFLQLEFHLTPAQLGFAVSGATLGCMVGALAAAPLADRLGRKKSLALTSFVFMAGCVGVVTAKTILQFDIFRILSGLGVGVVAAVGPMYVAEISPVRLRGRLVAISQMTIVTSGFLSLVVSYAFTPTSNWRAICATSIVPVLVLLAILPLIPESPRWLLEKGLGEKARQVLHWVYLDDDTASRVAGEISASFSKHESAAFTELLRPGVRKALLIGVVLAMCVQFTGIGPLSWYATIIFQKAGFIRTSDAMLQTLILNAWQLLCSIAHSASSIAPAAARFYWSESSVWRSP
jgi:SP family arabinose:H+ symporter-like MFS transporter